MLFTGLALALSVVVYVLLDSEEEPVTVRTKPSKRLKEGPVQVSLKAFATEAFAADAHAPSGRR